MVHSAFLVSMPLLSKHSTEQANVRGGAGSGFGWIGVSGRFRVRVTDTATRIELIRIIRLIRMIRLIRVIRHIPLIRLLGLLGLRRLFGLVGLSAFTALYH